MSEAQLLQPPVAEAGKGTMSLSLRELRRVATFMDKEVGIQLPDSKQTLVEGRLGKRLRKLGYNRYEDYLDFVLANPKGRHERLHLIDALTTNKTSFFREPEHFEFLLNTALPEICKNKQTDGNRKLNVWSAGCSSGEEAYTLSLVLNEELQNPAGLKFSILATDISDSSLATAKAAMYPEERIEPVALKLRQKYFLRSRDQALALVQMGSELRSKVQFGSLNLMNKSFGLKQKMDVIFCRNVMIYFDSQVREQLVRRFAQQLVPGGYLFVGHSESLNGLDIGLTQVAPMVYRKQDIG